MSISSLQGITSFNSESQVSIPSGLIIIYSGSLSFDASNNVLSSSVPSGWLYCDGTNGTPDLRSKFIYSSSTALNTGGASTNNFSHSHSGSGTSTSSGTHSHTGSAMTSTSAGDHSHSYSGTSGTVSGTSSFNTGNSTPAISFSTGHTHSFSATSSTTGAHTHSLPGSTTSAAGDHSHTFSATFPTSGDSAANNIPPYIVSCYLMKA